MPGDPAEPLLSGAPFFHNNVFIGNGYNGLGVGADGVQPTPINGDGSLLIDDPNEDVNALPTAVNNTTDREFATDDVNAVWHGSDLTYFVRGTIAMGPDAGFPPPPVSHTTQAGSEQKATVSLTIQSTLPGTILADGSVVAKPGLPG